MQNGNRKELAGNDDPRSMDRPGEPIAYAEARAELALAGIRAISGRAVLPPVNWDKECDGGENCQCK